MNDPGILYVVATPIGNYKDMGQRAIEVLTAVDMILAEDTRHSARLLRHFGISTPARSMHEHNERQLVDKLVGEIAQGRTMALICDAGTPLISDPGFPLVRALRARGLRVVPVPGPCALICALSVAGLATDRFYFEGFLPHKSGARRRCVERLKPLGCTLIFYESPHRLLATLADIEAVLGAERRCVIARELTKTYESIYTGSIHAVGERMSTLERELRGELVILVEGAPERDEHAMLSESDMRTLTILMRDLPLAQAVGLATRLTEKSRNTLYAAALDLSSDLER